MTAGAVEEVDEQVNEGVDERSMPVSRDTEAEIDLQGQDEFHQQGERESTNTKSTKKKHIEFNAKRNITGPHNKKSRIWRLRSEPPPKYKRC